VCGDVRKKRCLPAAISVEADAPLEVPADLGCLSVGTTGLLWARETKVLRDFLSHAQLSLAPAFLTFLDSDWS
jgi:hypothetical protein